MFAFGKDQSIRKYSVCLKFTEHMAWLELDFPFVFNLPRIRMRRSLVGLHYTVQVNCILLE